MTTNDSQTPPAPSPQSHATDSKPQNITILNQLIFDDHGFYRVEKGGLVYYLTIATDVFDEDTMCRPYLLIPQLPPFLDNDWTKMKIRKDPDGSVIVTTSNDPLAYISESLTWHDQFVDVLTLERQQSFKSNVHEVVYQGKPAIAKIAIFEWDVSRIANETWAYSVLSKYYDAHPTEPAISPRVLAHITEDGGVIGLLLEKIDGDCASSENLAECEVVLRKLHGIGLVHGDVNRYNFMIAKPGGQVKMVDYEYAMKYEKEAAQTELDSLPAELSEETGRGRAVLI